MMAIERRDYFDVSQSSDLESLKTNLVAFAHRMEFGLISAVLMKGDINSPNVVGRSIGNTPQAFVEMSTNLAYAQGDPVMQRVMQESVPFIYDQKLYVESGVADRWEMQAFHGYCTGISVGMHMKNDRHFLLGVDRPKRLPRSEKRLTEMLAQLQLLAVHAEAAAQRLLGSEIEPPVKLPHLTPRELECLRWTMAGKSAWAVGQILDITSRAVNFHLQNAMHKLEVSNKHSAVLRCVEFGLL